MYRRSLIMKSMLGICSLLLMTTASAFQSPTTTRARKSRMTTCYDTAQAQEYLKREYPIFDELIMCKNADVWKKLSDSTMGYTIFCLPNVAMNALGEKRLGQLRDIRNTETAEKMAAFHAVNEPVTAEELFASGGVITLGGVVDVTRSTTGGIFGVGGKEDGGVTVNGAKVAASTKLGSCTFHEVNKLISPELLWRYCDQLRIPGTK
jgi:uncharacterized surface protein with fasciclin (FAS1) repeats